VNGYKQKVSCLADRDYRKLVCVYIYKEIMQIIVNDDHLIFELVWFIFKGGYGSYNIHCRQNIRAFLQMPHPNANSSPVGG